MSHGGVDQVHFADLALVLLERRDLLRVRRPQKDRAITVRPSGVVGGVAVVLRAVGGELRLLAAGDFAHPQVVVTDESGQLAVGRGRVDARGAAAASTSAAAWARRFGARVGIAFGASEVATPTLTGGRERNARVVGGHRELGEREVISVVSAARRCRDRRSHLGVVEGGSARSLRRIDQDELASFGDRIAIPEAFVAEPSRACTASKHQERGVVGHELFRAGVVIRRKDALLSRRGERKG